MELNNLKQILNQKTAYLMDMDGTMLDLEAVNYTGYKNTVKELLSLNLENIEYQKYFAGTQTVRAFTKYLDDKNINYSQELIDKLVAGFRQIKGYELENNTDNVVTLKPGLIEFLQEAKNNGKKLAIATSTIKRFTNIIVDFFDLRKFYDAILTADDITNSKPHPEIYETAMKRLSATPIQSIVFEDAKNGILSAKNAGVQCVGIWTKGLNDDFVKNADFVIEDYKELM